MKQILSILLCLVMAFSLAACGNSDAEQTDADSKSSTMASANAGTEEESAGTSDEYSDDAGDSDILLFDVMEEVITTEEPTAAKAEETTTEKAVETTTEEAKTTTTTKKAETTTTKKQEETTTTQKQTETTTKKEEETTTEEEDTVVIPLAMDEVITKLTASDTSNDAGDLGVKYDGFDDTADVIACIEEYISVLEENYGYTLLDSEQIASCYYVYYLNSSDSSLEYITYRDHTCQMAIEGFADDRYGWKEVFLYYSPTIVGNYRSDGGAGSSGSDSGSGSGITYTCTQCHGTGICQYCNGVGYTTAYYYLNGTLRSSDKRCTKCHGSGICGSCDGSGEREG